MDKPITYHGKYVPRPRYAEPSHRTLIAKLMVKLAASDTMVLVKNEQQGFKFPTLLRGPGELDENLQPYVEPGWVLAAFGDPMDDELIWFSEETGFSSDFRFTIVDVLCLECQNGGGPWAGDFCPTCQAEQDEVAALAKLDEVARLVVNTSVLENVSHLHTLTSSAEGIMSLRDACVKLLRDEGLLDPPVSVPHGS